MAKKKGIINSIAEGIHSVVGAVKQNKDGDGEGGSSKLSNFSSPQQVNSKPQADYNKKYNGQGGAFADAIGVGKRALAASGIGIDGLDTD